MGAQVIATDIDPQAVARTEKTLKRSGATDYRVEMSDSNPLPVADAACTRIVCLEVLEHVDSPQQLMSELVRVAKPGALFLLAVPDERSEAIQQTLAPPAYWAKPNHVRIFSQADFGGLVEQAGLVIEDRQFKSFFWAMWWTLFWAANQEFGEREQPVLYHWSQTWNELLKSKGGDQIAQKLDGLMPKSQVIIARKPA
jgi:SAM-dependent methyltransferase